jgi:hypothetical protein
MKEFEIQIISELVFFYASYIRYGKEHVKELAKEIESKYLQSSSLINPETYNLIGKLVDFYAPTKAKLPDYSESLNILKKLVQILEEYEDEKKNK